METYSNAASHTIEKLKTVIAELRKKTESQKENAERFEAQIEEHKETIKHLLQMLYGKKSEKGIVGHDIDQGLLFDVEPAEDVEEDEAVSEDDTVEVEGHKRLKKGRKPLPAELPRVEVIIDIPDDEKTCPCGDDLTKIGEVVSERLRYIPAKVEVVREIRLQYACRSCEGTEDDGPTVKIAALPPRLLPKSIATPELLAHILVSKFADALPFYRQEQMFARIGVDMNRTTMCQWTMKVAEACQELFDALHSEIRSGPLINIDETTVKVLKKTGPSPDTKSQMWVCRGGDPAKPVLLFFYSPSREGEMAKTILGDFQGAVQTDGFSGYDYLDEVDGIDHLGCFSHARRGFVNLVKALGKKEDNKSKDKSKSKKVKKQNSNAEKAVRLIRKLYKIERTLRADKELSPEAFIAKRRDLAEPVLKELKKFLDELKPKTPPKGILGKAIGYALRQWSRLVKYLDYAEATPDNNLVENAIRPFVIGRKNWLFFGHARGAQSGAVMYSLIETAKANGLEPYQYLRYIFEKLPFAHTPEDYRALLPLNLTPEKIQSCCN